MASPPTVLVEKTPPIAEIILNRPEQRNAVNSLLLDELSAALERLDADAQVRVILLRAAGPVFCAGNDLKERATMDDDAVLVRRRQGHATLLRIEQLSKPCIAVVHGPAIGAGSEMTLACDFAFAGESATFRFPEGVRGTLGATRRLPRVVGKALAKELLFSGREIAAEEALRIGIVTRVVPDNQLLYSARDMAATIAKNEPYAMQLTKRAVDDGMNTDLEGARELELQAIRAALAYQAQRRDPAGD